MEEDGVYSSANGPDVLTMRNMDASMDAMLPSPHKDPSQSPEVSSQFLNKQKPPR